MIVICDDLEIRNVDSFGRKKREISIEKWLQNGKEKRKNRKKIVAGTLTILDKNEMEITTIKRQKLVNSKSEYSTSSQKFCVQKQHLEIVVIIGVLIILSQIAFIVTCYKRLKKSSSNYQENDREGSLYSESTNSSKYNTVRTPPPRLHHFR
ncbi:unnamed protein product [Caenorhabditis angaria]|uniref:Uncharacterized protein n=1 Tax=Caenorhabditis angaria TaxID=860376 RepID=A0A9P1IS21_9PELO|nr:unnamed protein product [Caenorhabditis angaria]